MCVYTCIRIYMGVHVYICVYVVECIRVRGYVCVSSCVWLRVAVFRIRLVRSGPLQETRTRSGFVLVVDSIRRKFEDRLMEWSVDQYRFLQWRPDGNSVLKPHHFMWVFVFVYLPLSVCTYMLLLSFHVTFCYILTLWLLVSLHETSVIVHLMYLVDMNTYWHHFMLSLIHIWRCRRRG